jgi:hypothetical protein
MQQIANRCGERESDHRQAHYPTPAATARRLDAKHEPSDQRYGSGGHCIDRRCDYGK